MRFNRGSGDEGILQPTANVGVWKPEAEDITKYNINRSSGLIQLSSQNGWTKYFATTVNVVPRALVKTH